MLLGVMWLMTAMVIGFMLGRVSMYGQLSYGQEEPEEDETDREARASEECNPEGSPSPGRSFRRRGKGHRTEECAFSSVGSPVAGDVTVQREGEHPAVVIYPESDCLYAPAGGKITRLFPMGNSFLLATDFGAELYIQAGKGNDELMVRHYRPRVVQNEIVGKGKLLLEFDRHGLETDGESPEVTVCVESCPYGGGVKLTAGDRVRIGEEILRIKEPAPQESHFRYRAFD